MQKLQLSFAFSKKKKRTLKIDMEICDNNTFNSSPPFSPLLILFYEFFVCFNHLSPWLSLPVQGEAICPLGGDLLIFITQTSGGLASLSEIRNAVSFQRPLICSISFAKQGISD